MEKNTDLILLIDDDPIFNWLTYKMIKKLDDRRTIKTFANGHDAFLFLQEGYSPKGGYTLLLDINMPVLNGWEFVEGLNRAGFFRNSKEKNIGINIISSSIDPMDKEKAGQWPIIIKGYFTKPLEIDDMMLILGHKG
ncbi:response regulator [Flagellimonas halotolerans]|uniref:Response regulator n=1 Tax=Flagellimonas halotolerans TaxID=3112164 RepID=A0ABU6ISH6_9FLAO|nr:MULTISPECIES: response regulator [unclassified Allomuricauda]MEC3966229.1 response regulator [Muricauda sp. SYSU M86414]MEC4266085.1 response regulator [Muricauda sp. SYSU M84420]